MRDSFNHLVDRLPQQDYIGMVVAVEAAKADASASMREFTNVGEIKKQIQQTPLKELIKLFTTQFKKDATLWVQFVEFVREYDGDTELNTEALTPMQEIAYK
jgi:hypothetical protein